MQVGHRSGAGESDLLGTNTFRATHRSNADSTMATARLVDVNLTDTAGTKSERNKGRAPAVLVGSPTGAEVSCFAVTEPCHEPCWIMWAAEGMLSSQRGHVLRAALGHTFLPLQLIIQGPVLWQSLLVHSLCFVLSGMVTPMRAPSTGTIEELPVASPYRSTMKDTSGGTSQHGLLRWAYVHVHPCTQTSHMQPLCNMLCILQKLGPDYVLTGPLATAMSWLLLTVLSWLLPTVQLALDAQTPGKARDMVVSSDSEQESAGSPRSPRKGRQGKGKKSKKHLTEEEMEALMEAKGAKKAREWLDSGFGGFGQVGGLFLR